MTNTATAGLVERSTSRFNILWKVSELESQRSNPRVRVPKIFFPFNVSFFLRENRISRVIRESTCIIWRVLYSFANDSISFDAMAKQTPYRYSADAKEIIRNVHNFCKQE